MISLRRHIDHYRDSLGDAALEAYRSLLLLIGKSADAAVPGIRTELNRNLSHLQRSLESSAMPDSIDSAQARVKTELERWAEVAIQHHNEQERDMRAIVGALERATEAIGTRDERNNREFRELTGRVRSTAQLTDLSSMRRSILNSAEALQQHVERMSQESRAAMQQLTAEMSDCRKRLEESERISGTDELTGLSNRRQFETCLHGKISARAPFALLMIDLNGFKTVNDRHGHLAGDDLLRQFAGELRHQFSPADLVGRWGGDEFVIIMNGGLLPGDDVKQRLRRWVLGSYKLTSGSKTTDVHLDAAMAVSEWNGSETESHLLARVDAELYRQKAGAVQSVG